MTEETEKYNRPIIERQMIAAGQEIEELMVYYPCLREICRGLKTGAYPAAMFAGAAFLGTLMTRCTYRFYHRPRELRRLNYSVFIIGDPGSGKSFASMLYELLAGPIRKVSKEGENAENRYRRKRKEWLDNGQKGDGPQKPKVLIRTHPARTSNKVFIEDMKNAVEMVDGKEMHLHMLSFDTELDNTMRQQGEAWNNKTYLELKAFHNEEDGQFYASYDSELCDFHVFWNFVYTGTPNALKSKVNAKNIGNGFSTRLAAIPMPTTHFEMLKREELKDAGVEPEEYKTMRMWAERLDKVHGELPISKLVDCTYEWAKDRMEDAKEDQSKTDELLLKRVPYYGIAVSVPFIMMRHWDEWQQHQTLSIDDTDLRLCRLVMDIQFWCQRHFFARYWDYYFMQQAQCISAPIHKRHTKLMRARYSALPDEFSNLTLQVILGVTQRTAEKMIERWYKDGFIDRTETGLYKKLFLELT